MRFDVGPHHVLRNVAGAHGVVAPRPQVPAPVLPAQLAILLQEHPAAAPLQSLDHLADRDVRRYGHQQMHMVDRHVPLLDLHIQRLAGLTDQIPRPYSDIATQHLAPVLRDPHDVDLQIVDRVGCLPIAHGAILAVPSTSLQPDRCAGCCTSCRHRSIPHERPSPTHVVENGSAES